MLPVRRGHLFSCVACTSALPPTDVSSSQVPVPQPTNTYAPTPAPTALPTLRPSSRYTCSAKSCAALGWGNAASLYGDDDGEGDV